MVSKKIFFFITLALLCLTIPSPVFAGDGVLILCYHDVGKTDKNDYTVSRDVLENHFNYLKENGYNPISLKQYIDANAGGGQLPDKPVLITFDDGYQSFYTEVFPLLQKHRYPAVLSLVTAWQGGNKPPDVGQLVTWQQAREMEASGLVAIASHTHDLHRGISANSYGDRGEAGSALIWSNGKYESLDEYKARLTKDMAAAQEVFQRELGHKAEALVWPYGEYTMFGAEEGLRQGFKVLFTLGSGANPAGEKSLLEARRGIIRKNPDRQKFAKLLKNQGDEDPLLRAAWVNIDQIYVPENPRQLDTNVRFLIERYGRLNINTVFLQTFSDPQGNGTIDSVYFQTAAAPVKAAVFDHIARRFRDEGIYVYAVIPTLSVSGTDLYTDLARYSFLDGVVFMDDVQDARTAAKRPEWKAGAITDFTLQAAGIIRQYKPYAKFIRSIYPAAITNKPGPDNNAPDYPGYLASYDFTLLMTDSYGAKQAPRSLESAGETAAAALALPSAREKVIFLVPTFDGEKKKWVSPKDLKELTKLLSAKGIRFFAYYPDTMFNDTAGVPQP